MKRIIIAIAAILACAPALAQGTFDQPRSTQLSAHDIGQGWELSVHQPDGDTRFCTMSKVFNGSEYLRRRGIHRMLFMVKGFNFGKPAYMFEIASEGFKVAEGKEYKGAVYFSTKKNPTDRDLNGPSVDWKATAAGAGSVWTVVPPQFLADVATSNVVNPVVGRLDLGYFAMNGSAVAMRVLADCAKNVAYGKNKSRSGQQDAGETF